MRNLFDFSESLAPWFNTAETVVQNLRTLLLTVGEGALGLIVNLIGLTVIARTYGEDGLGIYAFLLSVLFISGHLAEFGLPRCAEHQIALQTEGHGAPPEIPAALFRATLVAGLLAAGFFWVFAGVDAASTRVEEKAVAYLIIGMTLPIRNLNRLKLSLLHGLGRHEVAGRFKMQRWIIFLVLLLLLLAVPVFPSLLMLAFLGSEIALAWMTRKKLKQPGLKTLGRNLRDVPTTLAGGYPFLFSGETLDIVFYVDFFVLGCFATAPEIGVYSQASILARFFLIVPLSLKPLLRRRYLTLAAKGLQREVDGFLRLTTRILFALHALLALYILTNFTKVLHFFFAARGDQLIAFQLFAVLVPGLLFFAALVAHEPVNEIGQRMAGLRTLTGWVALVNLGLNVYLVPFAGYWGAAAATMISALVYFFLFGRRLDRKFRIDKSVFLLAGAPVYLTYVLFQHLDWGPALEVWLLPLCLGALLWASGFFTPENEADRLIRPAIHLHGGFIDGK